ncbi:hypothetical protein [Paenibacillus thiaminolyticus]|nr:hypothetical protein [Paenibacillus thiaminolyticus]WII36816.1 hypothetical protein O0V01_24805 [Paenibacillus thiaminolyticus]
MLYHMWVRHDLTPGAFWSLPAGEQKLLLAFTMKEIETIPKPPKRGGKRG